MANFTLSAPLIKPNHLHLVQSVWELHHPSGSSFSQRCKPWMPLPPWSVDPGEDLFFKYYGLRQNFLGFVIFFVVFISLSLSSRIFFIIIIIIALIIIIILLIIIIDTIIITISGSEQLIFPHQLWARGGVGEQLLWCRHWFVIVVHYNH